MNTLPKTGSDWRKEDAWETCDICGSPFPGSELERNDDGFLVCATDLEVTTLSELQSMDQEKLWGENPRERP